MIADLRPAAHFPPDRQVHLINIMLKPGGMPYREEVFVFNRLDLVGNIGGFMGLLLGASLLSLYDFVQDAVKKIVKRPRQTLVKLV